MLSNWRGKQTLHESLVETQVVAIEGIDTRALTRHLREHGSQQGCITHLDLDHERAIGRARQAPGIVGRDLAAEVTCARPFEWTTGTGDWAPWPNSDAIGSGARWRVVAYDFGIKYNILRRLVDVGCDVTVVPAATPAEAVEALKPHGIFLSNGPGDPEGVPYAAKAVEQLIGRYPIFGICLGHQILGLAFGLRTYKLKFGHHGANHPVMDLRTRKVEITSQNHNFAVQAQPVLVDVPKVPPVIETRYGRLAITHVSLNDCSVEGMASLEHPVFSVQYHPEAAPGPHDAAYLFGEFVRRMENHYA